MNILFLDAYFEPEQIAFTHLEHDLLEGLVNAGHEVYVVCPTPTRGISKEVALEFKKKKREELYGGHVHVTRFAAPQEGRNPIIRAFRYFWCNLRTYQIGKKTKYIDAVFSNSTPPTQGWIAGRIAGKIGIPFIYSLQDIFPDSLLNAGMTVEKSLIWNIGRILENKTYSLAKKIIVISENFRENIREKGVSEDKITVIPNWIDTDEVRPVDRKDNILFDRYHLDREKFYVCYSGNIGHSQNLELLVQAAEKIVASAPDIVFVIIGDGAAKQELEQKVKEKKLTNVVMLPYQPYEEIAHVFSLGDVGLIISKPGIGGSSVPSKTWSIMAAQRPVLASFDADTELGRLISRVQCGKIADAGNPDQFVRALMDMYQNREQLDDMAEKARQYVSKELNRTKCVAEYISLFCS